MIATSHRAQRDETEGALLQGVIRAASLIAAPGQDERGLKKALQAVGPAARADRVWVFKALAQASPADASGTLSARALWQRSRRIAGRAEAREVLYQTTPPHWHQRLAEGEPLQARADDLPASERTALEAHGVQATLVLPLHVQGRYWGGLRFDACRQPVGWTEKQVALLETLAEALARRCGTEARDAEAGKSQKKTSAKSLDAPSDKAASRSSSSTLHAVILAQISQAVLAVDEGGAIAFLNPEAEALFGAAADDVMGAPVDRLLPPYSAWLRSGAVRQALDAGEAWRTEIVRRRDEAPGPQHLEVALNAVEVPGEDARTVVVAVRDVTEARHRKRQLEHRARMERTLAEVSTLFVSPGDFEPEELLGRVGQALEADRVYLITAPPDDRPTQPGHPPGGDGQAGAPRLSAARAGTRGWPIDLNAYTYREWCAQAPASGNAPGEEAEDGDLAAFAVPVLSPQDKLYGYLGIEYAGAAPGWPEEDTRMLNVLGDMMAAYLERRIAEAALRESEERYRLFVTAISEGIWCVEPVEPVSLDQPPEAQVQALRERGVVVDCNESMAGALGYEKPGDVIGRPAAEVIPDGFDREFFHDFVTAGGALKSREYTLYPETGPARHFVVNAVGTVEDDALVRIWWSCTDVTERVELERRMVTALEQQQQRIGHELHDGVGQLITGVRMLSQNLAERHFDEGEKGYEQAHRIVRYTQEASQILRELQRGLAPVQVYGKGLASVLEGLAHTTDGLPGITCSFVYDGETDVEESEAKLQLYRIAQEATNNALKHAEPSHIQIAFRREDGRTVLSISDDGCGFDLKEAEDKSLGLHSMHYRARVVQASLEVHSAPGDGTTVRCTLAEAEGQE